MTQSQAHKKHLFISMRWRFILPLVIVVTVGAMISAYWLASQMTQGFQMSENTVLIQSSQAVANRAGTLYTRQRAEAQRVAFTQGIAEDILFNNVTALHDTLEALARTADLDSIIVTDTAGLEVAGVLRVRNSDPVDYSVSTQSDLRGETVVRAVIEDETVGAPGFIQTPQGLLTYVAVPIQNDGSFMGVALVGQRLPVLIASLRASAIAHLALYGQDGVPYYTSLDLDTATLQALRVPASTITQALNASAPIADTITLSTTRYRTLYTPFSYGGQVLGVIATLAPDNIPFTTALGRQLSALFAAGLAGVVVVMTFIVVDRYAVRLRRVQRTAQALTAGQRDARTGMRPSDEIGAVGVALDQYATVTQQREDQFRKQLWRQRRERNYMIAVFEAIPEALMVHDREGQMVMMNDAARQLLGAHPGIHAEIAALQAHVPTTIGSKIAPGVYALGEPHKLENAGQMVTAQVAAIMTHHKNRIGTVMVLRDITAEVQTEQAREALLAQLSADIQQPLVDLAQAEARKTHSERREFAREISRHAAALQKMIVDMRELTRYSPQHSRAMQRPLLAQTLLYAVANDWRQIAQAARLELRVIINQPQTYVLGDESRLRWAMGNLVDNAIKYTPAGGTVALEIQTIADNMLHLRVRDNGVGISEVDLKLVFMPFYRGTPMQVDGTVIHVPGMGQGLPLAKQVIQAHGGAIKVKSRAGVGSAVYFSLPITADTSYALPLRHADMDGETVKLAEDADWETFWQR
ncbi:MAG: ATP-binding protein [Anaerolineae bacterium]